MRNDSTVRNEVAELLAGLLFQKELPPITDSNLESLRAMFDAFDNICFVCLLLYKRERNNRRTYLRRRKDTNEY